MLMALGVVGVAAWLRLVDLSTIPFGWHPDEATKALLARDVLAGKYFPAFFSAFTGREALYVYLEAGLFALLGEAIFVARLLSAFGGILTVAFSYTLGRRLFNRRVGILAAVFLAASLWHLIASRNGYRAVIQPLIQLPTILALMQAWREDGSASTRAFVFAGFWLGLTQYTYTAARFFPVFVAALIGAYALLNKKAAWTRWRGHLVMVVVALLVFLPLGIHFVQHPADFFGRAAQVSVFSPEWSGGAPLARLWQSVKETARMFTIWGDINYRFNIAGQPVFGLVDGLLFYAGLAVCLARAIGGRGEFRLPFIAVLLWLVIMLAPMTLSAESLPYYQRAIGILPAVYFFPALALEEIFRRLSALSRNGGRAPRFAFALVTAVILLALSARTYGDYFERWHLAPRNDDDRRVAMVYLAHYLEEKDTDQPLFLSTEYVQHPTLALLSPKWYEQVKWFDGSQSMPLPAEGEEADYLFLRENAPPTFLLKRASSMQHSATEMDRFGRPVLDAYHWDGAEWPLADDKSPATWTWQIAFGANEDPRLRNAISLPVSFGGNIAFKGHSRHPEQPRPGDVLEIVLFWELLGRPGRAYTFFVHLLDENSNVVAGYDANGYPSAFWPESGGELLLSYFPLGIPSSVPPGEYQVEIGIYHPTSGDRVMIFQDGQAVADRLLLEPVVLEVANESE